jgi:Zn-dependent peptidase ImmA (M78 family)
MSKKSLKNIEFESKQLLSLYFKDKEKEFKTPIDPIDVLEYLGYSVEWVNGEIDSSIYGGLYIDQKTVKINNDIPLSEGIENFTIAHELGHLILHSSLEIKNKNSDCSFDLNYPNKYIEKEADNFAACLLMPETILKNIFYKIRKTPLMMENIFFLRLILRKSKRKEALAFASKIIKKGNFNVSKLAMVNRLISLGLIKGLKYQKNYSINEKYLNKYKNDYNKSNKGV